jgi:hypothetical protein
MRTRPYPPFSAPTSVLGRPSMTRERMICVSHRLVGIGRQTSDSAELSALRARIFMRCQVPLSGSPGSSIQVVVHVGGRSLPIRCG